MKYPKSKFKLGDKVSFKRRDEGGCYEIIGLGYHKDDQEWCYVINLPEEPDIDENVDEEGAYNWLTGKSSYSCIDQDTVECLPILNKSNQDYWTCSEREIELTNVAASIINNDDAGLNLL